MIYAGVLPEHQNKGINPLLLERVSRAMRDAGYKVCGNTWIADVNAASLRQREKMGARVLHRLHIYQKKL